MNMTFFGNSRFSVFILEELLKAGLKPARIVTTPDKPEGRKLTMTPTPVKVWAQKNNIPIYEPVKLDASFIELLKKDDSDLFIVASYGKIIPEAILEMPNHKTLNVHPSLLPLYRGPSPLPSSMLDDAKETGVTIMRIDKEVDHGPVLAQKKVAIAEWPTYEEFEERMAREGGQLLAATIPEWVAGKLKEQEQDHSKATFTKKVKKEDGLIILGADNYINFRKIQAYHEWPQAYFFRESGGRKFRVKVTKASYKDGKLGIESVIPEGGKEMSYEDFLHGYKK
ncbi:MAG: methionyl-tRNA formyltransferase [Candidatus Paceibacterota bacterium]